MVVTKENIQKVKLGLINLYDKIDKEVKDRTLANNLLDMVFDMESELK